VSSRLVGRRCLVVSISVLLTNFVLAAHAGKAVAPVLIDDVRKALAAQLSTGKRDFQICDLHSPGENHRTFAVRTLGERYVAAARAVDRAEMRARVIESPSELHLGVLGLTYEGENVAKEMHSTLDDQPSKTLSNSLILTPFVVVRRGAVVLVIYSETALDEHLKKLFATIDTAIPEE
jgi:hypothetical protein